MLSDSPIDHLKPDGVDALIVMSLDSYVSFSPAVKESGVIIYEESLVKISDRRPGVSYHGIPAVAAANKLGNPMAANMVILGAAHAITGKISLDALRASIADRFPRFVELNLKALDEGVRLGKNA